MNSFLEMEWNAKWDWENLAVFSSKTCGSPKKPQPTDWGIVEEEETDVGSFNLSGESGGSGSDLGHASSAKSSISIHASSKEGLTTSNFIFEASESSLGNFSKKKESTRAEIAGSSSPVEALVGPVESLIGLKLGKRTYFENNYAVSNKTSTFSMVPVSSATATKKIKSSCQSASVARCQVEGCNLDLSLAKDYHRKHRVCESHSKSPNVVVGGLERRFCQQCSRFHSLSEFDEKKRSCRRRLSDHNARRRKPQQETFQFHSTRLSSAFIEDGQQMNFILNNSPLVHSRPAANLTWDTCNSKFTLIKGSLSKSEKEGAIDGLSTVAEIQHPHATIMHASSRLLPSQGTIADVCNQGFKDPTFSVSKDAALDFRRALSLLSSNSWGSCEPELITLDDPVDVSHTNMLQHVMDTAPEGLPLALSEYCQNAQWNHPSMQSLSANSNGSGHFQEIQLFRAPNGTGTGLYTNPLN